MIELAKAETEIQTDTGYYTITLYPAKITVEFTTGYSKNPIYSERYKTEKKAMSEYIKLIKSLLENPE